MSGAGAGALHRVGLPFPLLKEGKVREVYDFGKVLLFVATDRISAFDCVLPQPIPDKGRVLTRLSRYWFERTHRLAGNHLLAADPEKILRRLPQLADTRSLWAGRSLLVERTEVFPVECVVRGYLSGSAWKEYRDSGTLAGEPLPEGLQESSRLPEPIFSPATKAVDGHDRNITYDDVCRTVGRQTARFLRDQSLALYEFGRETLAEAGILLADTKFEFGTSASGEILLIDEVLTPDSSRLWPEAGYAPGSTPPSLDKQPVRDYLEGLVREGRWDRQPPAPDLPVEVIERTSERYRESYRRIVGRDLEPA